MCTMSQSAVLVARRTEPTAEADLYTRWIRDTVTACGYTIAATRQQIRLEHNQYHIGPGMVEQLAEVITDTDSVSLILDNILHPGQRADLSTALPTVTVYDRRGLVWEHLAENNPLADLHYRRQRHRVRRRRLIEARREQPADGITGGSPQQVADIEQQLQRLETQIDQQHATMASPPMPGENTDLNVAFVQPPTTGSVWEAVPAVPTESDDPFRPATPTIETTTIDSLTATVSLLPACPPQLPDWYQQTVPGAMAIINRADAVCVYCEYPTDRQLYTAISERQSEEGITIPVVDNPTVAAAFPESVTPVTIADGPETLRKRLLTVVSKTPVRIQLPHTDTGYAVLSWLHDRTPVNDVTYADAILVDTVLTPQAREQFRAQTAEADVTVIENPTEPVS